MSFQEQNEQDLIQIQRQLIDELYETITNAKALAAVAVGCDFENFQEKVMHDYWGALHLILNRADMICSKLLRL